MLAQLGIVLLITLTLWAIWLAGQAQWAARYWEYLVQYPQVAYQGMLLLVLALYITWRDQMLFDALGLHIETALIPCVASLGSALLLAYLSGQL
jgi:hypothetical protein